MEFTEVEELDALATHGRVLPNGKATSNPTVSIYSQIDPTFKKATASNSLFDYEVALGDTPPHSPGRALKARPAQASRVIVDDGEEETPEAIMDVIEYTLKQQDAVVNISSEPLEKIEIKDQAERQDDARTEVTEGKEDDGSNDKNDTASTYFEKMRDDDVSKTYIETKNIKSFLSSNIKAFPSRNDYGPNKRFEVKTFRIYFLNEKYNTLIPLNPSITILEAIRQCLDIFKLNKTINEELLKYPSMPEAYDLKMNVEGPPLDKQKTFRDLRVGKELIIVECPNFKVGDATSKPQAPQQALIPIVIYLPTEDVRKVTIQMPPEKLIKDIFAQLATDGKPGMSIQRYNVRLYSNDPEARWKEAKNFLDANIPLGTLKAASKESGLQLELVRKKFADEPTEVLQTRTTVSPKKRGTIVDTLGEKNDEIILYNDVSANRYEEFEVIKINETGKRQVRILGIDGFKIYNYSRSYKEQGGGLGDMINSIFFSKFGTMNPERLITDVLFIRLLSPLMFQIAVKSEASEKVISYETADSRTTNQIAAKINYLKGLQEKKLNN